MAVGGTASRSPNIPVRLVTHSRIPMGIYLIKYL